MRKNNSKPNKLLGQNFLRDKNVLRQIIAAANLTADDTVLEVGPGEGILTEALSQSAGRVIAVEKDKNLSARLKEKFMNSKNVEIIEGDILKILNDLPLCKRGIEGDLENAEKILPNPSRIRRRGGAGKCGTSSFKKERKTQYKVVANIPYYLTSRLIRLLLERINPPKDIVLMIQKEVAQRICARPPQMSLLAVSVQFYAQPKIISFVSKNAFWPKPKVDSAIIRITPRNNFFPLCKRGIEGDLENAEKIFPARHASQGEAGRPGPSRIRRQGEIGERRTDSFTKKKTFNFFTLLHAGFSHPRKQLINNLSRELKMPRDKIADALQCAGLKPAQRAQTLCVNDWIKLTNLIQEEVRGS